MLLNTTPDPFFCFRFLLKINNSLTMIYEESIRKICRKNVNNVRVVVEIFFNFKYLMLFRSDNYLVIILGQREIESGIISGAGSFQGRFGVNFGVGDHFGVGIISGAVQITHVYWTVIQAICFAFFK